MIKNITLKLQIPDSTFAFSRTNSSEEMSRHKCCQHSSARRCLQASHRRWFPRARANPHSQWWQCEVPGLHPPTVAAPHSGSWNPKVGPSQIDGCLPSRVPELPLGPLVDLQWYAPFSPRCRESTWWRLQPTGPKRTSCLMLKAVEGNELLGRGVWSKMCFRNGENKASAISFHIKKLPTKNVPKRIFKKKSWFYCHKLTSLDHPWV